MKKSLILILSLLCLTVCSCQKEDNPQDMLIGTWDVTATITAQGGGSQESKGWSITFREDGTGTVVAADPLEFTYQYISENNTIRYTMEGIDSIMYVDSLTKDSFIIHTTDNEHISGIPWTLDYVFKGTKVKRLEEKHYLYTDKSSSHAHVRHP